MVQPVSSNLAQLIARLNNAGVGWDGENIADLLWLVNYIEAPQSDSSEVQQKDDSTTESVQIEEDKTPAAPLPDMSDFSLFSQSSQSIETKKPKIPQSGIPFQTPTAPALRKTLALGRSLRPLMRRVESYTQLVLDEEATAEQTAERQFCMTMVRPARERWLELVLVIEDSTSSFLWRDTIRDFQQVLEHQGAFRTVDVWYLQTAPSGSVALYAKRPVGDVLPRPRDPKEVIDTSGRRLILVLSDCISPAWRQGSLQSHYLEPWAKHGPLAIVQMLPIRLWSRTVLGAGLKTSFSARVPGTVNAQLINHLPFTEDGEPGLKLPVITLDPSSMGQWARMLAGFGDTQSTGVWFEPDWQDEPLEENDAPRASEADLSGDGDESRAKFLVDRFSNTASEIARELASLMALVPVELSLIYIIQAKLLPKSSPLHVAEVFLSGLIERVKENDTASDEKSPQGSLFSVKRRYQFLPYVREQLIDTVDTLDAEFVLNEISAYIGQKLGRSIYSFTALLRLKNELAEAGSEFLEFANVTKQALRRLGGQYAELVEVVEQETVVRQVPPIDLLQYPQLETLEFIKGELVDSADEPVVDYPPLKTATFDVATVAPSQERLDVFEFQLETLERKRTGILRRLNWVVKKSRAQGRHFIESLSEDVPLGMVFIPGGQFLMGSPGNEPERSDRESPQHKVTVPDFFIGRYLITQVQWRAVASMFQVNRELKADQFEFKGDDRPVENVSWYEAVKFCDLISQHTGRIYRLPTEAEWEYACRAGSTTPFHFGSTLTQEIANYDASKTYNDGPKGQASGSTTPVGQFDNANAFGLSDMHGNVWEWCQDIWHDNYEGAPTDGSAWTEGGNSDLRILRGGSWLDNPGICRSARRLNLTPGNRGDSIGFRVISVPPKSLP